MPRMLINAILDRSGSMQALTNDVIGNYNQYVNSLHDIKGIDVSVSLVIFDSEYTEVYINKRLSDVPLLDNSVYFARGSTALLDAVNRTINAVEALGNDTPDNVVFVINTDGYENASRETTKAALKERIERLTADRGWQFIFMGAGIDAFSEGGSIGTSWTNISSNSATPRGYHAGYSSLTGATQTYASSIVASASAGSPTQDVNFNLADALVPEEPEKNLDQRLADYKASKKKKETTSNVGNSK